jgi:hypothetical protein
MRMSKELWRRWGCEDIAAETLDAEEEQREVKTVELGGGGER